MKMEFISILLKNGKTYLYSNVERIIYNEGEMMIFTNEFATDIVFQISDIESFTVI